VKPTASRIAPSNIDFPIIIDRRLSVGRACLATTCFVILLLATGCTGNPYLSAPGGAAWQTPGATAWQTPGAPTAIDPTQAQLAELNRRVRLLDDNNRQLHTQLAQSEQQSQVYRDELNLVRQQLADTANRLDAAALAATEAKDRLQGVQASTQMRGGATIKANTNLQQLASQMNLGGLTVIPDGDTLRIIVPADQLFQPGTANLQPSAAPLLDNLAAQIRAVLPRQRIAIEGYADNAPIYGGRFATSHQLTSAQVSGILEMLTRRSGLPEAQLFTIAQGSNHPRASNDDASGRATNRRVEFVVYPDSF
jgi:flagellar motor protein MotB